MSRAVMQQALEVLEKVKTDADKQPPVYPWDIWRMWVDRAITLLRAALAEPEQEPLACIGTNGELMWLNKPKVIYSKPIPLYTAPTPRKPLTEEEIFNAAEPLGAFEYGDAQGHKRIAFARAIERAHGIGESNGQD